MYIIEILIILLTIGIFLILHYSPKCLWACKIYTFLFDRKTYNAYKTIKSNNKTIFYCTLNDYSKACLNYKHTVKLYNVNFNYLPSIYYIIPEEEAVFYNDKTIISGFYKPIINDILKMEK